MGRTHRRDHANTAHNLLKMCVSLHILHLSHIPMAWQTAQHSAIRHHSQRHSSSSANTRFMSYLYPQRLPPTARLTALRHQYAIHSHLLTSQIHSTATASSCPRGGTVGGRSWFYTTALTRKHGARHGSAICRPTPELTRTATTARGKCTHQGDKVRNLPPYLFPHS
jgi:hypothetical protein